VEAAEGARAVRPLLQVYLSLSLTDQLLPPNYNNLLTLT